MTLPNQEDGITPGLLWTTSYPAGTSYDLLDPGVFGGLTERLQWRNQPNVVEFLKARVQQMQSWNQSTADVWGPLRRGGPGQAVSLTLAMAEGIARQLLPIDLSTQFDTVEEALAAFGTAGDALWTFLGGFNPFDPSFNLDDAIAAFTSTMPELANLRDFTQDVIDNLLEAWTGLPSSGGPLTDLLSEASDLLLSTEDNASGLSDLVGTLFGGGTIGTTILGSVIPDYTTLLTNLFGGTSPLAQIQAGAVPTLAQTKISNLTTDLAARVLTTDYATLLTNLFGGTTPLSQIQLGAVPNYTTLLTNLFGGTTPLSQVQAGAVPNLAASKVPDLVTTMQNIYNNWFGGTAATGTPAEVATAVAAIKTTVAGGFTLQTFTSSNASWTVPTGLKNSTEAYAGVVGGGGKGAIGGQVETDTAGQTATGGAGGRGGGYKRVKIADPASLPTTLAITIGAGATTNGADGGSTSIGSLASSTPGVGSTEVSAEFLASSSLPGNGGDGGSATTGTVGSAGTGTGATGATGASSATATGGAGGAGIRGNGNQTASAGSTGGAGQTGTTPISGGAGGGGGGGAVSNGIFGTGNANGGAGGAGGYPGGGSGGGGAAACTADASATPTGGNGGTPANGFAFLLWK